MFQVAEHAAGIQQTVNLRVQRALSLMDDVMNRKTGNDGVKLAEARKRVIEIVSHNGDGGVAVKTLSSGLEHGRREVNGHGLDTRMFALCQLVKNQGQQASVTGSEVENSARRGRNELQQGRLALAAVLDGVGAFQILLRVSGVVPQVDVHRKSIGCGRILREGDPANMQ